MQKMQENEYTVHVKIVQICFGVTKYEDLLFEKKEEKKS